MQDKFYCPSRAEAPPGTTFESAGVDGYFRRGSDGRVYTTSSFGFNVLRFEMSPRQRAAWFEATGITDPELENATAREATTWGSEQYDRDVRKLHIEADRLGFTCAQKVGPPTDTFRRQFDEYGLPTGAVINNRTGAMALDSSIELPLIDIPAPINAQSGFETTRQEIMEDYQRRGELVSRPWWRKLLALRLDFRFRIFDKDEEDGI